MAKEAGLQISGRTWTRGHVVWRLVSECVCVDRGSHTTRSGVYRA